MTLGSQYARTLFVIPSGTEAKRSHSVSYRFKPAADFSYLCGLHLAGSLLLILGDRTYLLCEKHKDQVWGEHTALTDADRSRLEGISLDSVDRIEEIIRGHAGDYDRIAVSLGRDPAAESRLTSLISYDRRLRGRQAAPIPICDSRLLVGTLRMIKDETEIKNLREAGARSSRVHTRLMQESLTGKTERDVSNWIEANFLLENMQWVAYETIVGSGDRSTLLHARATDRIIQENDIVLVDAGGEWNGYCSDITRTIPAGGKFSPAQKKVYGIVLAAQKAAVQFVKPGRTLQELHDLTVNTLIDEMVTLGHEGTHVREHISAIMPHSTSHWIGMDVHDPSPYMDDAGNAIRLKQGMCFTVEPGLYFRDSKLFENYHRIGMRIEDDVLVTEEGSSLLNSVPKELEEIEQLRARAV